MGQAECIEVLEKNRGWMTQKQISDELKQEPGLVNRSLRKLCQTGFIQRQHDIKYKYKII